MFQLGKYFHHFLLEWFSSKACKRLKQPPQSFSSLSTRWMCFRSQLQPSWRVHLKCGFMIYSDSATDGMLVRICADSDVFELCFPGVLFAKVLAVLFCVVGFVPCRAPAGTMQAAAAALAVLSVFFSLDGLSALRFKRNQNQHQNERNTPKQETGAKKKNQPHILFILTDDQVCVNISWWWSRLEQLIPQDASLTVTPTPKIQFVINKFKCMRVFIRMVNFLQYKCSCSN